VNSNKKSWGRNDATGLKKVDRYDQRMTSAFGGPVSPKKSQKRGAGGGMSCVYAGVRKGGTVTGTFES